VLRLLAPLIAFAVVLLAVVGVRAVVARQQEAQQAATAAAFRSFPANPTIEERWGIRFTAVNVLADGGIVELRYIVIDPAKGARIHSGKLADLRFALESKFGPIDEVRQEANIGPIISAEIAQQALILIILGSIGILAWVTFRFQDFRMGATAITALIHDVIVVVGTFAIAGTLFGLQIDALFVTAMLTVIGFSVHDTIVVYDRIRENRIRHAGEPFEAIVNHSLLQTLGRSLNTSLTTVLVLTALLLFGSDATRAFVFAMVIGIISGTYSSIFNASALLVDWHLYDDRRREREFAVARGR